jgi:hypothetical protein
MAMNFPNEATYSVLLRLQRTTIEWSSVSVPVTDVVMDVQSDGTGRINTEKLAKVALEMGKLPSLKWMLDGQTIQLHPVQIPRSEYPTE